MAKKTRIERIFDYVEGLMWLGFAVCLGGIFLIAICFIIFFLFALLA